MIAAVLNLASRCIRPSWVTGPIFDKELRVSSRRKRNYVLRFVYLAMLTIFVVLVWLSVTRIYGYSSAAFRVSRMAEAGKSIITTIIWFQFYTTQLLAVIMLSNAISDEIYHKTLGVLMTTPINSFQIVMGKLFSKLWQLMILLAISIPLLAIVRVFGGVPWEFVISSICINLTAVIFAGSVSIYFSIRNRRSYAVILKVLFVGGVLYAFLPWLFMMLLNELFSEETLIPIFLHTNPFAAFVFNTFSMMTPFMGRAMLYFSWPLHCGIMLTASALVLGLTVKTVRKVALRQATGEAGLFVKRRQRRAQKRDEQKGTVAEVPVGRIRRVKGSAIIWKELKTPLLKGGRITAVIGVLAAIAGTVITYAVCADEDCLDMAVTQVVYGVIFVIMGTVCTAVLSATAITSEKEARSWPILLATPLSDWNILIGKAVGIFRKCLPIWLFLAAHVIIFVIVGYIHPIAIVHLGMLVIWVVVFFTGSGLYFSSRFKRTTAAVVMNFGLGVTLWAIIPMVLGLTMAIGSHSDEGLVELSLMTNPLVQTGVIMEGASGTRNVRLGLAQLRYNWPDSLRDNVAVAATTKRMLVFMIGYILAGVLFAWRAKCRFRRNIF
ncbi:MAG TPA: hypothetical protein ENH84_04260 [Phycisphaerae bacterium]|nr:hypothetical protein [Phycisphaerae bacterium]